MFCSQDQFPNSPCYFHAFKYISPLFTIVWVVLIAVLFQADSDFYVVAELLKDYIGLIQSVKVNWYIVHVF